VLCRVRHSRRSWRVDRDLRYYNNKFNPDPPEDWIQAEFDFNPDVIEKRLPPGYDDAPPDDNDDADA
jgi:hypothetical protein